MPPHLHRAALQDFSDDVRQALGTLLLSELRESAWLQAQLGIINGGLGLKDAAKHAPAAYLASVWACKDLCARIDPAFGIDDLEEAENFKDALAELRNSCLPEANLEFSGRHVTQKHLSSMVDGRVKEELRNVCRGDRAALAHLNLVSQPCAGAWLLAPPKDDGRQMETNLFRVALKRWLRMPVLCNDGYCPCCGDLMDTYGDHALVCSCHGDRTVKHNTIRNIYYDEALATAWRVEREKANLLPQRPVEDGIKVETGARRPADVWIPRTGRMSGEALDFACTSGMRADFMNRTIEDGSAIFPWYEDFKRSYRDTDQKCADEGFTISSWKGKTP